MANNKKSFVLYCDLIATVDHLPDKKAGELFKHILKYVNDENPISKDLIVRIAFEPIKQQLKRDLKKYEKRRSASAENGKLGGRPKKPKETKKNPQKPIRLREIELVDEDKNGLFQVWLDYRIALKKPIKVRSTVERLAKKFNDENVDKIRWVVNESIMNGWQGLFWEKYNGAKMKGTAKSAVDELNEKLGIS